MLCEETKVEIQDNDHCDYQFCPICGNIIGIMPGSADAICKNCGFKDPCCE